MLPNGAVSPCFQVDERQLRMARQMMTSFRWGKLRPLRVVFGLKVWLGRFFARRRPNAKRRRRARWARSRPSSSGSAPRCSASRNAVLNRVIRQAGMVSKGAVFISLRLTSAGPIGCGPTECAGMVLEQSLRALSILPILPQALKTQKPAEGGLNLTCDAEAS